MEYAINRTFKRRDDADAIATKLVKITVTGMTIDGKAVPSASIERFLEHGLQILQDAYAGAGSFEDAKKAFNDKLEKLMTGTLGTRGGGESVDEETQVARELVRGSFTKNATKAEKAKYKAMSTDERVAFIDRLIAAYRASEKEEAFAATLANAMAARKAAREAQAALGGITL